MKRREFLKVGGMAAAGMALAGASAATDRPNVLLLIVDQMRLPRWFPQDAPLPAYDRLRREGLLFSNHYVSCVPCSASRATLFTGLHMPQHRVEVNCQRFARRRSRYSFGPELAPELPTLGHLFRDAGWRTPYFGKWHLSYTGDPATPDLTRYGFTDWIGPDHFGGVREGLQWDAAFADQAVAWLDAHGREPQPWFLTCSLINPHDICYFPNRAVPARKVPDVCDRVPDNFHDDLKGKPGIHRDWRRLWGRLYGSELMTERMGRHYLDCYYFFQLQAEAELCRVLDALDRTGQADNTIVALFSDHGEMAGSHRLMSKGPYVYDENNRAPFMLRWPGRVPAGAEARALAQSVDLFPTLLALAGVKHDCSRLPGKSLMPAIAEPAVSGINDHVLMAWGYGRDGFNETGRRFLQPEVRSPAQVRAIYDGRYKFARYFDPGLDEEYELYDLQEDPLEMTNLANDQGRRALSRELRDRLRKAEAVEMAPGGEHRSSTL